MTEALIQITSRYFCAGIVLKEGTVKTAAPILKYMRGWNLNKVRNYSTGKGWKITTVRNND